MIKSLIKNGYFNYDKYLLDHYLDFNLTLKDMYILKVFILQMLNNNYSLKAAAKLIKSHLNDSDYKDSLANLLNSTLVLIQVDYSSGTGVEFFNLDNFFLKIEDIYRNNIISSNQQTKILEIINEHCKNNLNKLQYQQVLEHISNNSLTLSLLKDIIAKIKSNHEEVTLYRILSLIPTTHEVDKEDALSKFIKDNNLRVG